MDTLTYEGIVLQVGDKIAYTRIGSSYVYQGVVLGFTPKNVKIKCDDKDNTYSDILHKDIRHILWIG